LFIDISIFLYFREQVEKGLTFLGFLVTENRVKPETTPVIQQLMKANIRTVMVTGKAIVKKRRGNGTLILQDTEQPIRCLCWTTHS
jgi:hypothetical protein